MEFVNLVMRNWLIMLKGLGSHKMTTHHRMAFCHRISVGWLLYYHVDISNNYETYHFIGKQEQTVFRVQTDLTLVY